MATVKTIDVNVLKVIRQQPYVLRLTGVKQLRIRIWLAVNLIRLAAWVSGGSITVEH